MIAGQLRRIARAQWRRMDDAYRAATAPARTLPDFLIVGEAKCGTTSLYDDLAQHPCVLEAAVKEVHFFDIRFRRGLEWYRAQFPLEWQMQRKKGPTARQTGEASPYYMFHPHAPARIKQALPNVKLIVMLRNPVERAYSQYQHEFRRGREPLASFEEAIAAEPERLRGEHERMLGDEWYNSLEHRRHSYVARGIYVNQLQMLCRQFDRQQILIIKSEDYFSAPDVTCKRVREFLGLPAWEPVFFAKKNVGTYAPIDRRLRKRLADYFAPHNSSLYDFLGTDFGWD
jgi:hypothetical protein